MKPLHPLYLAALAVAACAPDSDGFVGDSPCEECSGCPSGGDSGPGSADGDGDGYPDAEDCDDGDAAVHPGADELCDGVDNDCDGAVDEDPVDEPTWYADEDEDGYGCDDTTRQACEAPTGYAAVGGDCDDGDDTIHPGASEVCGDGVDSDCDGGPGPCGPAAVSGLAEVDIQLLGGSEQGHAGTALALAGDVNGDGYVDLLVGAGGEDGDEGDMGAVYLVSGPLDTGGELASHLRLEGAAVDDYAGYAVAGLGDVDADGYDDILVGVSRYDSSGSDLGAAYLLLGPLTASQGLADVSSKFVGSNDYGLVGSAVAGPGDVDGDGYADLLVGASSEDVDGDRCGCAYLLRGPATSYGRISKADAKLGGEEVGDQAGSVVAGIGDMDGDGFPDVAVGAPYQDEGGGMAGAAYRVPMPVEGDVALAEVGQKLMGAASGDYAGCSLAGVGDVDADGYADLLVGAYGVDDADTQAGAAYLVLGSAALQVGVPFTLPAGGATLLGVAAFDWAGTAVAAAGDVDADGYDDLLVSAPGHDDGESLETGVAYWVRGPLSGTTSLGDAAAVLGGGAAYDRVGSLAAAGDVDADGYDDILVGAPYADSTVEGSTVEDSGVVYLLLGGGL